MCAWTSDGPRQLQAACKATDTELWRAFWAECCLKGAWNVKHKYHLWFLRFCVLSSGAPAEIFKPDADAGTADVCGDSEGSAASSPRRQGT